MPENIWVRNNPPPPPPHTHTQKESKNIGAWQSEQRDPDKCDIISPGTSGEVETNFQTVTKTGYATNMTYF